MASTEDEDGLSAKLEWPTTEVRSARSRVPHRPTVEIARRLAARQAERSGAVESATRPPAERGELMAPGMPTPASGFPTVASRVEALTHASVSLQSLVSDRLEEHRSEVLRCVDDAVAPLEEHAAEQMRMIKDLSERLDALQEVQRQLLDAVALLVEGDRHTIAPTSGDPAGGPPPPIAEPSPPRSPPPVPPTWPISRPERKSGRGWGRQSAQVPPEPPPIPVPPTPPPLPAMAAAPEAKAAPPDRGAKAAPEEDDRVPTLTIDPKALTTRPPAPGPTPAPAPAPKAKSAPSPPVDRPVGTEVVRLTKSLRRLVARRQER